jgi:hypothetical protein
MQSDAGSNRILHDEHAKAGDLASLDLGTNDYYVKKYKKRRKHEKNRYGGFVKKPRKTRHACGMVNKFLTNIMFINIAYLCIAIF